MILIKICHFWCSSFVRSVCITIRTSQLHYRVCLCPRRCVGGQTCAISITHNTTWCTVVMVIYELHANTMTCIIKSQRNLQPHQNSQRQWWQCEFATLFFLSLHRMHPVPSLSGDRSVRGSKVHENRRIKWKWIKQELKTSNSEFRLVIAFIAMTRHFRAPNTLHYIGA